MLSYSEMTDAVIKIVTHFKWEVFGFFLFNFNDTSKGAKLIILKCFESFLNFPSIIGHSECSLMLSPFHRHLNNGSSFHETFENTKNIDIIKEKLSRLKEKSRSKYQWDLSKIILFSCFSCLNFIKFKKLCFV